MSVPMKQNLGKYDNLLSTRIFVLYFERILYADASTDNENHAEIVPRSRIKSVLGFEIKCDMRYELETWTKWLVNFVILYYQM